MRSGTGYFGWIVLFCTYNKLQFSSFTITEINNGFVRSQFLYVVWNANALAINFIALLITDGTGQLQ